MREFTTAVQSVTDQVGWLEFKVDGTLCRAISKPTEGQVAFIVANSTRHKSTSDKVAAMLNFFDSTLDDDTQAYLSGRLLDPKDSFGMEDVQNILEGLMEEWSGRPTQQSSDSTSSPPPTGPSSSPLTPVSTSSPYAPTPS